jgi:hypothetical protein
MDNFINILSILAVILLGVYIASIDFRFASRQKEDTFRLIKVAYASVGLMWAGLYSSFLVNPAWTYAPISRFIVRGLVILTLIALAMGSTARAYMAGIFKGKDLSI